MVLCSEKKNNTTRSLCVSRHGLRRSLRLVRPERGAAGSLQVGEEPGADRKRQIGAQTGAGSRVQGGRNDQDQYEDHGE